MASLVLSPARLCSLKSLARHVRVRLRRREARSNNVVFISVLFTFLLCNRMPAVSLLSHQPLFQGLYTRSFILLRGYTNLYMFVKRLLRLIAWLTTVVDGKCPVCWPQRRDWFVAVDVSGGADSVAVVGNHQWTTRT